MKKKMIVCSLAAIIGLSGCGNNTSHETKGHEETTHEEMNHESMNHSSSGEVPEGLKVEENPKYKVGSQVILKTDHMEGMKGAKATIVGAYETTAYVVTYTPTTGGERVEDHKWVIQEEIENAADNLFKPGTEVSLEANHMNGMQGATAEIESAEATTVYMVNYTSTTEGDTVKNHKWVTENELTTH